MMEKSAPLIGCGFFYFLIDVAAHRSIEEIRLHIGADSLHYLSLEGMLRILERPHEFCTACFDGTYPVEIFGNDSKVSII